MKKQVKMPLIVLSLLALFTALHVVLSRFLSVNTLYFKIDTGFLAVTLAAYYFGPVGGALVGGLSDFLGAVLFPTGSYFFPFTCSAVLVGLWFGFALRGPFRYYKPVLAVLPTQLVCSLLLNSWFLSLLTGKEIRTLIFSLRIPQAAIASVIQIAVMIVLAKQVLPRLPIERTKILF